MKTIDECLRELTRDQLIDTACRLGVLPEGEFSDSKSFYRRLIAQKVNGDAPRVRSVLNLNGIEAALKMMKEYGQKDAEAEVPFDVAEDGGLNEDTIEQLHELGLAWRAEDSWHILPQVWELIHYPESEKPRLEAEAEVYYSASGLLLLYGMIEEKRMRVLLRRELDALPGCDLVELMETLFGINVTWSLEENGEIWLCSTYLRDAEELFGQLHTRAAAKLPWATFNEEERMMASVLNMMGSAKLYGRMEAWLMAQDPEDEPRDLITAAMIVTQNNSEDEGADLLETAAGVPLDGEANAAWDELTAFMPRWCLKGWSLRTAQERYGVDILDVLEPDETLDQPPLMPVVRETPKVGRNDPCPCGSGKKYKNCCGKLN